MQFKIETPIQNDLGKCGSISLSNVVDGYVKLQNYNIEDA